MKKLCEFWFRLRALFRRSRLDAEMREEMQHHLELSAAEKKAEGVPPDEARHAAQRKFGGVEQMKECVRDERGFVRLEQLWQDLRFGARTLRKHPGFAAVAVLTLGLGIGVNTAVFSLVDAILLRPLPYPQPDRLVRIWRADSQNGRQFIDASFPDFQRFKEARAFVAAAAFSVAPRILRDEAGEPIHVTIGRMSDSICALLAVPPLLGRDFTDDELAQGQKSALISHRLWLNRYNASSTVIDRIILIDGEPHRVIGVMAPGANYPRGADIWRPLTAAETADDDPELTILARLAPHTTIAQAEAEVRAIATHITRTRADAGTTAWVQSLQAMLARDVRAPLLLMLGVVGFVLLIACANVANLLLARGVVRAPEIAVRTALGAGRGRVVRQLLAEHALIAVAGAAVGLLLGSWAINSLVALADDLLPRVNAIAVNWRVVSVMIGVTGLAGLLCGLLPAQHATRLDLQTALKGGASGAIGSGRRRWRESLMVAEVALATVLVVCAGLLLRSFTKMLQLDRGFHPENVLVVPLHAHGQEAARFVADCEQLLTGMRSLPGVESAAFAMRTPLEVRGFKLPFRAHDGTTAESFNAIVRPVTPDYFRATRIPILSGEAFPSDVRATGPGLVIVNRALARVLFGGADPVGRQLRSPEMGERLLTIVGVVPNLKPGGEFDDGPAVYLPLAQFPVAGGSLLLRTSGDPRRIAPAVRERVRSFTPLLPLDRIHTLEQKLAESSTTPRLTTWVVGLFALTGLALAGAGIYGVMSVSVAERTREMAVRRALGASENALVRAILREGLRLTLLGSVIGLALAAAVTRVLATQLVDVSPTDPTTFVAVVVLSVVVGLLGCYLPARRATRADPVIALRAW